MGDVMTDSSEYAKDQVEKHRRKIILPCVIPWEYGSNKYASQKGSGGFGRIRNTTLDIRSTKELSKGDNVEVPFHICPAMHGTGATQAGHTPFGGFREHVQKVQEHNDEDKKRINEMLVDPKATERVLKLWSQSNPEAKNDELYGKRRGAVSECVGGRRFTTAELIKSRAALPRFQNVRETSAARDQRVGEGGGLVTGFQAHRQATTVINGLDRSPQDQLDSNRYMAWLGGQLTLQSQSRTGGFQKPRDVTGNNFYAKVMREKNLSPAELFELRKAEREQKLQTVKVKSVAESLMSDKDEEEEGEEE